MNLKNPRYLAAVEQGLTLRALSRAISGQPDKLDKASTPDKRHPYDGWRTLAEVLARHGGEQKKETR